MGRHVLDPLTVDIDFAVILQRVEVLCPSKRPLLVGDSVFGSHGVFSRLLTYLHCRNRNADREYRYRLVEQ